MIQWMGDNMGELLAYTGHKNVVVNSFGNPCVWDVEQEQYIVMAPGDFAHWQDETLWVLHRKLPGWDE